MAWYRVMLPSACYGFPSLYEAVSQSLGFPILFVARWAAGSKSNLGRTRIRYRTGVTCRGR